MAGDPRGPPRHLGFLSPSTPRSREAPCRVLPSRAGGLRAQRVTTFDHFQSAGRTGLREARDVVIFPPCGPANADLTSGRRTDYNCARAPLGRSSRLRSTSRDRTERPRRPRRREGYREASSRDPPPPSGGSCKNEDVFPMFSEEKAGPRGRPARRSPRSRARPRALERIAGSISRNTVSLTVFVPPRR
ncbi:hypothetical protein SKAU_G00314390 [Synaphobranchus kaupii]|uniref:Uncharacterized protein n=1 Tax=Synaphobranchus kaupii TaxID=118154 RepID=A0A9Q1ILN8_SYNKA|nr:hypothetical protein SKAU_G00314390 [Synaphobranchus kaupii]